MAVKAFLCSAARKQVSILGGKKEGNENKSVKQEGIRSHPTQQLYRLSSQSLGHGTHPAIQLALGKWKVLQKNQQSVDEKLPLLPPSLHSLPLLTNLPALGFQESSSKPPSNCCNAYNTLGKQPMFKSIYSHPNHGMNPWLKKKKISLTHLSS